MRRDRKRNACARAALLALALLAGAGAGAASGQTSSETFSVGVGFGRFYGGNFAGGATHLSEQKLGADDDILKGLWIGVPISRRWDLEFAVRRTRTHVVERQGGIAPTQPAVAEFIPATIEISALRAWRSGRVVPYVGFGAGMMNVELDTPNPAVRDVNRVCLSISGGTRLFMTRWAGLRLDLRGRATYLGKRQFGKDGGWTDRGRWFANAELLGGFFLAFGGRSPL